MSIDLRQIAWMRAQWKRFRRILLGLLLALALMLVVVTVVLIYLLFMVRRELKDLERQSNELRVAQIQQEGG